MTATLSAWLFPGQGSQSVGMGWELVKGFAPAAELLALAGELSGFDLTRLCLRGPEAELTRTDRLQPALTAINLGCARLLLEQGLEPDYVAGHSLGEFSALYAAGVLEAEPVLRLVTERGRLMQAAARDLDGAMAAVKGLPAERVEALAAASGVAVANYNAPDQVVLSGPRTELGRACRAVAAAGGEAVTLNVSGPWHHPLLEPAAAAFRQILEPMPFAVPRWPVMLNVDAAPCTDPARIKTLLGVQMTRPVRWQAAMETLFAAGVEDFIEVGPGKVLRGLLHRLRPDRWGQRSLGVDGPRALKFLSRETGPRETGPRVAGPRVAGPHSAGPR